MKELINVIRYESRESIIKYYEYGDTRMRDAVILYNNRIGMLTEEIRRSIQPEVREFCENILKKSAEFS